MPVTMPPNAPPSGIGGTSAKPVTKSSNAASPVATKSQTTAAAKPGSPAAATATSDHNARSKPRPPLGAKAEAFLRRARAEAQAFEAELQKVYAGEKPVAEFLALTPRDAPGLVGFAAQLLEQDDLEGAEASAEIATLADPRSFEAWLVLGAARARQSQEEKALSAYAKAAQINAKDARLWTDIGELKLILLDYEGAAKALGLAIDVDPEATTPAGRRAQFLVAKTYAKLTQKK